MGDQGRGSWSKSPWGAQGNFVGTPTCRLGAWPAHSLASCSRRAEPLIRGAALRIFSLRAQFLSERETSQLNSKILQKLDAWHPASW